MRGPRKPQRVGVLSKTLKIIDLLQELAALSISGPTSRMPSQKTAMLGGAVKAAAQKISARIVSELAHRSTFIIPGHP